MFDSVRSHEPIAWRFCWFTEVYLWFGYSGAIPYVKDTEKCRAIDADEIVSLQ